MDCDDDVGLRDVDLVFAEVVALARPVREHEAVPVGRAMGRVTAEDIRTATPLPPFDHSAVDGYGLTEQDLGCEGLPLHVVDRIAAGSAGGRPLAPGEAARLLTGASIPPGVAAVLFEERCRRHGDTVFPGGRMVAGANIRRQGEDVGCGEVIVARGTFLDARHAALLAAAGVTTVQVIRILRVAVLSNGNELREPGDPLGPGTIHDSNRPMLTALLAGSSIQVVDGGLHRDDPDALGQAIDQAAACDVVFCSGGASGSDADHVERAILACGGEARRVRLQLKPGKPIILGMLRDRPILGLPGNPVAAMVNFLLFGRPLLRATVSAPPHCPVGQGAVAAEPFPHSRGRREFLPARIVGHDADGRVRLAKLGRGGSARLRPLATADGLAEIAADRGDVAPDEAVRFHPFAALLTP